MRAANTTPQDEIIYSEDAKINCDGGGGPLGHPRVYLDLSREGEVHCPYCSRHFIWKNFKA